MEKGWEQVATVLAVHRLQCAYLHVRAVVELGPSNMFSKMAANCLNSSAIADHC